MAMIIINNYDASRVIMGMMMMMSLRMTTNVDLWTECVLQGVYASGTPLVVQICKDMHQDHNHQQSLPSSEPLWSSKLCLAFNSYSCPEKEGGKVICSDDNDNGDEDDEDGDGNGDDEDGDGNGDEIA